MSAKAAFGQTGHESTRTIFGAAALAAVSPNEAAATLEVLLEYGVNHIDTAASYGDSELRVAPWLTRHSDQFFLATKTGKRDYEGARQEIRRSLERLGVDQVDLLQLHNLVDVIEWEFALREGGALDAAIEARDEGLVRFLGVWVPRTPFGLSSELDPGPARIPRAPRESVLSAPTILVSRARANTRLLRAWQGGWARPRGV